jgi:hypothetical protein
MNITGISFIIITNGAKSDITHESIRLIRNTMTDTIPYEIILSGDVSKFTSDTDLIFYECPELASSGNLSAMRNRAADISKYDLLVFLDDDVWLSDDWYTRLKLFSESNPFDVYSNKILLPDGGRYWDRAVIFDTVQVMVRYSHDKNDPNLYQTGTYLVIQRDVFMKIKFNENILYYSGSKDSKLKVNEDVDFSRRLYQAGYCIDFDETNIVYHRDFRVVQTGSNVQVKTEQLLSSWGDISIWTRYEQIFYLYKKYLKRLPDADGFRRYLLDNTLSEVQIEEILRDSEECKNLSKFDYTYLIDESKPHLGGNFADNDQASYSEQVWKYIVSNYDIKTCLDVGSGRGFSAKFISSLGVSVTAIDGLHDNVVNAVVPTLEVDLTQQEFIHNVDFVNCIEVVEHIDEKYINNLMTTLANGKYVLITHAFPGQQGWHHVNCQPSSYWIDKFSSIGYQLLAEETAHIRQLASSDNAEHIQRSGLLFIKGEQ